MNDSPKGNQKHKSGVNPAVAAATGAVIGAGIAAAGAYALRNEKNRNKVKKVLSNVRDQAMDYVENFEEVAKGEIQERVPALKSGSGKKTSKK